MALIKTETDLHARECFFKRDVEAVIAATDYLLNAQETADHHDREGAPLWYGWALHKAFLAGVRFEKIRQSVPKKEKTDAKEKPADPPKRKGKA